MSDPYISTPVERNRSDWIAPYIFDSSLQFNIKDDRVVNEFTGNPIRSDEGVERHYYTHPQTPRGDQSASVSLPRFRYARDE